MAATFDLLFKLKGVLNGEEASIGEDYSPYQVSTSADIKFEKIVSVNDSTATEIVTIGSGEDLASAVALVIIPTVSGALVWSTSTAADNSAIQLRANFPFIFPTGNSYPYQTTLSNRADETAAAIANISFYQTSGSAAKVHIFGIG